MAPERLQAANSLRAFAESPLAPIGFAVGGLLVEPLGATTTLYASGFLLAALPALLWAIPGVRRLRSGV